MFSSSCVVLHAFSAQCMYSKFGHHPHPLGYPCAKFCFSGDLRYWASPWKKLCTQSINHSITHSPSLIEAPGTEAFARSISNKTISFKISRSEPVLVPWFSVGECQPRLVTSGLAAMNLCATSCVASLETSTSRETRRAARAASPDPRTCLVLHTAYTSSWL